MIRSKSIRLSQSVTGKNDLYCGICVLQTIFKYWQRATNPYKEINTSQPVTQREDTSAKIGANALYVSLSEPSLKDPSQLRETFLREFEKLRRHCNLHMYLRTSTGPLGSLQNMLRVLEIETSVRHTLQVFLGRLPRENRQRASIHVGGYYAPKSADMARRAATTLGNIPSQRDPDIRTNPYEYPVPQDLKERIGAYRADTSKVRFSSRYIPHWILADPEIALSKTDRKVDPW